MTSRLIYYFRFSITPRQRKIDSQNEVLTSSVCCRAMQHLAHDVTIQGWVGTIMVGIICGYGTLARDPQNLLKDVPFNKDDPT